MRAVISTAELLNRSPVEPYSQEFPEVIEDVFDNGYATVCGFNRFDCANPCLYSLPVFGAVSTAFCDLPLLHASFFAHMVLRHGSCLAVGLHDGRISLWNMETRRHACTLAYHTRPITSVSYAVLSVR